MARLATLTAFAVIGFTASSALAEGEAATCVAFLPNSTTFVYGTVGGQVCLSGVEGRILYESKGLVSAITVSPDGRIVACCLRDAVALLNIKTGEEVVTLRQRSSSVAFSPEGNRVAIAGSHGVHVWDSGTGKTVRLFADATDCVAFSPDGRQLAAGQESGVRLFDATSGALLRNVWEWRRPEFAIILDPPLSPSLDFAGFVRGLMFTLDGRRLCAAGSGAYRAYGKRVETLVKDDNGKASVPKNQSKVWETATGQEVFSAAGSKTETCASVFGRAGRHTAFMDGTTICISDIANKDSVEEIASREEWVSGLAISDDGTLLATAGAEGVKPWEMPQEKPIGQGGEAALLDHLSSRDAKAATRAVFGLAGNPPKSIPLLREALRPARPVSDKVLALLLADMESGSFAVRQKATAELERLERLARPALEKLLSSNPSLEVKRRAEHLLAQLEEPRLSPHVLRGIRGVEVLERIASSESKRVLQELSQGEPDARLTQEAKAALARMTRR